MRTENAASLSDRDFTELSEKIEKSVSKRIKDAEVGQREILKMIENLTSKIDTLTERPPNNVRHGPDDEDAENAEYRYRLVEPSDLLPNHGQHRSLQYEQNASRKQKQGFNETGTSQVGAISKAQIKSKGGPFGNKNNREKVTYLLKKRKGGPFSPIWFFRLRLNSRVIEQIGDEHWTTTHEQN